MRSGWVGVIGLGLLLPATAARGADWLTDYAEAQALARKSGKPLLVVFR
jgi:hypothetical protein